MCNSDSSYSIITVICFSCKWYMTALTGLTHFTQSGLSTWLKLKTAIAMCCMYYVEVLICLSRWGNHKRYPFWCRYCNIWEGSLCSTTVSRRFKVFEAAWNRKVEMSCDSQTAISSPGHLLIIENPLELIIYCNILHTVMCLIRLLLSRRFLWNVCFHYASPPHFKANWNLICCFTPRIHWFM